MSLKTSQYRTVAPSDPVLTLSEAYQQLRLDAVGSPPSHPDDALLTAEIAAIVADLDAGTGWLGRAIGAQTWRMGLSNFPDGACRIWLPYPPFIEIVSIVYTDNDGDTVTLTEGTDYRVMRGGTLGDHVYLKPAYDSAWPTDCRNDEDAVLITWRCGYVTGSPEVSAVPEQIKNVVRAVLTETYDTRGVYDNSAILRGQVLARVMDTLNNIRIWTDEP